MLFLIAALQGTKAISLYEVWEKVNTLHNVIHVIYQLSSHHNITARTASYQISFQLIPSTPLVLRCSWVSKRPCNHLAFSVFYSPSSEYQAEEGLLLGWRGEELMNPGISQPAPM